MEDGYDKDVYSLAAENDEDGRQEAGSGEGQKAPLSQAYTIASGIIDQVRNAMAANKEDVTKSIEEVAVLEAIINREVSKAIVGCRSNSEEVSSSWSTEGLAVTDDNEDGLDKVFIYCGNAKAH